MRRFVIHWLVIALALGATTWILPGVRVESAPALFVAALVLGFLNAVLKPFLVLITLPITLLTLGLFYFILNAMLFALGAFLVPGFSIDGFGWALVGTIVMGLLSMFLGSLLSTSEAKSEAA
jgi:putative membrane protein